ncbi:hypothetical protein RhiJN_24061 [Ceratobasidium sp. AG-Ba]|nr:hypothetical protein RhiJN_24061 [Ceratobasidium sp. AG-Ba]
MAAPPSPPNSPQFNGGLHLSMNNDASAKFRRDILELLSSLRASGLSQVLQLPQIAVIGGQSSGKSSLIEALCQVKLPRSTGTCTRSSYADHPWAARVYLMKAESDGQDRSRWSNEVPFGDPVHDPDLLEVRISQAQQAALHPRVDPSIFLNGGPGPEQGGLSFTKNRVIVKVSGDQLADLSFVDLPGIIANTTEENVGDIELVQKLISSYMRKKTTINLIVITCEVDFETQVAGRLARNYDPNGERTIGVITKPDRIEPHQEGRWIRLITGQEHQLAHGWFCTKQPATHEREQGFTWQDARTQEDVYFRAAHGWSAIAGEHRNNLGTKQLAQKLGKVLTTEVEKCLPGIRQEIGRLIESNQAELRKLPELHPEGPRDLVQITVSDFVRAVEKHLIKGNPSVGQRGVVQTIREFLNEMRDELQEAAPVFIPNVDNPQGSQLERPSFLAPDERWLTTSTCGNEHKMEEVAEYANGARTREWPGHFPFQVMLDYTEKFVNEWNDPVKRCFERVVKSFETKLLDLVQIHFGAYSYGGLLSLVRQIALDLAEDCRSNTSLLLDKCIDQELHPETTHEDLYIHYEAQFTDYYRRFFESTHGFDLLALVLELGAAGPEVAAAIRVLESHGLPGMSPSEWRNVQPTKRQDRDALRIMASVRAHYQVAFKRFSDKVKDTINQSYTYEFGKRIENSLRRGLQLNSADATEEYFAHLTVESEDVETLRAVLKDKAKKLYDARMKLC